MASSIKDRIANICAEGWQTMPPTPYYDSGAPGNYLQSKFGISVNNRETADLSDDGFDLKTCGSDQVTLFHLNLWPRGLRPCVGKRIFNEFAYMNDNGRMGLRHPVYGETPTTGRRASGFYKKIEDGRINLYHISRQEPLGYWPVDFVVNRITVKLWNVYAFDNERRGDQVRFSRAIKHQEIRSSQILGMIAEGTILTEIGMYVDEDGRFWDNGIEFRIRRNVFSTLWSLHDEIC